MQIPILNGIFSDVSPDFRTSYPVNMVPTPKDTGISQGYLRVADGVVANGEGPGNGRGGIVWNGTAYRVMGSKLVLLPEGGGTVELGDVGPGGQCAFDYSFDRLAINSGNRLYYWDGATLTQVTDPDLGDVFDVIWVDGYFMTTDGEFLVVTELNDPTQVNPLKFGSSEVDPDPVQRLLKWRNEVYALNRYTIEVFDNVGGALFPFQRNEGAQIQRGCVGRRAACLFADAIAFVGSARNEAPSVYLAVNSSSAKISTQEIDQLLLEYTEDELSQIVVEARNDRQHQFLHIHLPDRCLVYDAAASQALQLPVWFTLTSALEGFSKYRARNFLWAYDSWLVEDTTSSQIGVLTRDTGAHWGQPVRWEFGTQIVYNEGRGAIMSGLELVALTGSVEFGTNPTISTSYSIDGLVWSQPRFANVGTFGERAKRVAWWRQGRMRNWRIQRFQGTTDARLVIARLEAAIEPLAF